MKEKKIVKYDKREVNKSNNPVFRSHFGETPIKTLQSEESGEEGNDE